MLLYLGNYLLPPHSWHGIILCCSTEVTIVHHRVCRWPEPYIPKTFGRFLYLLLLQRTGTLSVIL
jgi:hypothetical protein